MDHPTWLLSGVLATWWLLISAFIPQYRLTSVTYRYNEVLEAFVSPKKDTQRELLCHSDLNGPLQSNTESITDPQRPLA